MAHPELTMQRCINGFLSSFGMVVLTLSKYSISVFVPTVIVANSFKQFDLNILKDYHASFVLDIYSTLNWYIHEFTKTGICFRNN